LADTTKSSIPIHSKFLMAILKGFTMPPINGDDTYEQMSIGVALNSVVATDGPRPREVLISLAASEAGHE